jgi:hypothetical protein
MKPATLLLALALSSFSTLRAAETCAGRKGSVTIDSLKPEGGFVEMAGTWAASPGTERLALEIRIDQDRQALEVHEGASGAWSAKVPFPHCGKHLLRVYAFAAVANASRTTLCFEGAPSTPRPFEVDCTPVALLDRCSFDCPKPKAPAGKGGKAKPAPGAASGLPAGATGPEIPCTATCTGTAQGGAGSILAMYSVAGAQFQVVDGPAAGPWSLDFRCKPGEKITFLVRDRSGTGATSKPAEKECAKQ